MVQEGKTLNLYQRIVKVMSEVPNIPKRGYNSYSKYNYVLATDVINEVSKLLWKHGISLTISEKEFSREKVDKNFFSTIKCTATFTNIDDPNDFKEVDYYSVSADTLDKDIFKAKTNGLKYVLTETFLIVTDLIIDTEQDSVRKKNSIPTGGTIEKHYPSSNLQKLYVKLSECTSGLDTDQKKQYVEKTLGVSSADLKKKDDAFVLKCIEKLENQSEQ